MVGQGHQILRSGNLQEGREDAKELEGRIAQGCLTRREKGKKERRQEGERPLKEKQEGVTRMAPASSNGGPSPRCAAIAPWPLS